MISAVSQISQASQTTSHSELDRNGSGYTDVLMLKSSVTGELIQPKAHYTFVYIIM
jgi:hypothetical protein